MHTSRFFSTDDIHSNNFFFDLHPAWWSRIYEYPWAGSFAQPNDICLDAACGVSHPLKFYLLDRCKEVYANDIDKRLLSRVEMLKEINEVYGEKADLDFKYSAKIKYSTASITDLPYNNNFFDKIYCISVLEHLHDHFNQRKALKKAKVNNVLGLFYKKDLYKSLQEFNRILKPGGLLIITFDFPVINLDYFREIVNLCNLKFAGDTSFELPKNAVYSDTYKLHCFRTVLTK
jgi:SAM-dependent methyltransferase